MAGNVGCGSGVAEKKIGPHQKHPKVFAKKFSGWGSHFGTLWPRKSQKMAILGQKSHVSEISVAENGGGRSGVAEKNLG